MAAWTFIVFTLIYLTGSEFTAPLIMLWLVGFLIALIARAVPAFGWFLIGVFNGLLGGR